MSRCKYAKRYKATRVPSCGCEACINKFTARIARQIWHYPDEAREGRYTVLRVLQEAKVIRTP